MAIPNMPYCARHSPPQHDGTDGWVAEKMPLPRVMGDALVLPNGKVIVLNGAVKGLAGDNAAGGAAKANEPALWPVLYDPDAPLGSRMTVLARSNIPRMYHSTVSITTDGSLLVAGCDRCDRCISWPQQRGMSLRGELRPYL